MDFAVSNQSAARVQDQCPSSIANETEYGKEMVVWRVSRLVRVSKIMQHVVARVVSALSVLIKCSAFFFYMDTESILLYVR